jgi:hypothetical protein
VRRWGTARFTIPWRGWEEDAETGECIERMTEIYGAPVHEDEFVVVYEIRAPDAS